jgi:hypothetical protein
MVNVPEDWVPLVKHHTINVVNRKNSENSQDQKEIKYLESLFIPPPLPPPRKDINSPKVDKRRNTPPSPKVQRRNNPPSPKVQRRNNPPSPKVDKRNKSPQLQRKVEKTSIDIPSSPIATNKMKNLLFTPPSSTKFEKISFIPPPPPPPKAEKLVSNCPPVPRTVKDNMSSIFTPTKISTPRKSQTYSFIPFKSLPPPIKLEELSNNNLPPLPPITDIPQIDNLTLPVENFKEIKFDIIPEEPRSMCPREDGITMDICSDLLNQIETLNSNKAELKKKPSYFEQLVFGNMNTYSRVRTPRGEDKLKTPRGDVKLEDHLEYCTRLLEQIHKKSVSNKYATIS